MTANSLGAVEAIFTLLALHYQIVPATANLNKVDNEIDGMLDFVKGNSRSLVDKNTLNYAMSNSFGFGGTNSTLVFKKI